MTVRPMRAVVAEDSSKASVFTGQQHFGMMGLRTTPGAGGFDRSQIDDFDAEPDQIIQVEKSDRLLDPY